MWPARITANAGAHEPSPPRRPPAPFPRWRRWGAFGVLAASLTLAGCTQEAREARRIESRAKALGAPAWVLAFPDPADMPGQGSFSSHPWFRNQWRRGRLEAWARRETDRGAVVFVGDSITAGWTSLAVDFPPLHVANRGISGDTSRGVLFRWRRDVLDLEPAGVVLLIGINDLLQGTGPETVQANIQAILSETRRHRPDMPVILCRVLPVGSAHAAVRGRIDTLNRLLLALPATFRNVTVCDTWSPLAGEAGSARPSEIPDGLHPAPAGYGKLAAALRPLLPAAAPQAPPPPP